MELAVKQALHAYAPTPEVDTPKEVADHAPQRLDLRDYAEWVRRYDTLTPQDLNAIKERWRP
ncbi:MAG: hypothetical protein R3E56_20590 [Burkholderiaceae bacterium]